MSTKKVATIVAVVIVGALVIGGIQGGQALALAPTAAPAQSMATHEACTAGNIDAMHEDLEAAPEEHCDENGDIDHGDMHGDMDTHHTGMHGH